MRSSATILTLCLLTLAAASNVRAQDSDMPTRFMMLNQHQCPGDVMGDLMDLSKSTLVPALESLEEEGQIDDWGILTHAWGDEYNFNFYIVTETHGAFLDAWGNLMSNMSEIDPEWYDKLAPLCTAHKDNMYVLHKTE